MTFKLEKKIDDLISSSNPLHLVELCDEYMKDEGCKLICNKLLSIDSINTIDLKGNDIQQIGAQYIVELISKNRNITTLKLEWNLLGSQNALNILCDGLLMSSIAHLDLRNNKIESDGAQIISEMLMNNTYLYHIDLRWNNLGSNGGQYIYQTLSRDNDNHTLTECLLSGNQISVQILRSIDCQLKRNKEYQSIKQERNAENIQNIENIKETSNEISNCLQEKNEAIETLQQEINDLFGTKTCLNDENERMNAKISELETQILDLKHKEEISENQKRQKQEDITKLKEKYDADTNELKKKIKEFEIHLEEIVNSRCSDKKEFENIKETIENNHNVEINTLRETKELELNEWRARVNELHIKINDLKSANNILRSDLLQNEIANERKYIEFEKNLRSECNGRLSSKISDLEINICKIRESRDDLENEMKKEKEKYSTLIDQIETEKKQYQEWLNDEQKLKVNLENDKRSLSMEIQKYLNVITQKNQQIESLKIGLKETQKSIKTLENEHQLSMKRILNQNNRQIMSLEKSLRENEQRLTLAEHRKRNLELRLLKLEDEEQRKIAAVYDAVKMLTNSFEIATNYNSYCMNDVTENKENEKDNEKINKNKNEIIMDYDGSETIIEIIEDDDDELDYMRDHNTFNMKQKNKNKT